MEATAETRVQKEKIEILPDIFDETSDFAVVCGASNDAAVETRDLGLVEAEVAVWTTPELCDILLESKT